MKNILDVNINKKKFLFIALLFIALIFNIYSSANAIILIVFLYILINFKSNAINLQFLALFFFTFFFRFIQIFHYEQNIQSIITSVFHFVGMYALGYVLVYKNPSALYFKRFIHIIIVCTVLYALLSSVYTMMYFPEQITPGYRIVTIPWQNNVISPSTNIGGYLCIGVTLIGLQLIKISLKERMFYAFVFIISIILTFVLGNRAQVLFSAASVSFILLITLLKFIKPEKKPLIILTAVSLLSYILYLFDIFNLKTMIAASTLGQRTKMFALSDDPRLSRIIQAFKDLLIYPVGRVRNEFAHNMWLDVAVDSGVIPFALLVMFSIITLYNHYRFLKSNYSDQLKCLLSCLLVGIFLQCLMEPVIHGIVIVFQIMCFQAGATAMLIKSKYNKLQFLNNINRRE